MNILQSFKALSLLQQISLFVVVLILAGTGYAFAREYRGSTLTVAFLDVGKGDAIFIETPSGRQILVDGGAGSETLSKLSGVMPFYDRSIDLAVLTNPSSEYAGGMVSVLERFTLGQFFDAGSSATSAPQTLLRAELVKKHIPYAALRRGDRLDLGDGVLLSIFFPDRDIGLKAGKDGSIIALLSYGNQKFLLAPSSTKNIENYLAEVDPKTLRANVLAVGDPGIDPAFRAAVAPQYVVIFSENKQRASGPIENSTDQTKTLATGFRGSIIFKTDGQSLAVTTVK